MNQRPSNPNHLPSSTSSRELSSVVESLRARLTADYPDWHPTQVEWVVLSEAPRIAAYMQSQWEPDHEDLMAEVANQRMANPHLSFVDLVDTARLVLQGRHAAWTSYSGEWKSCDHEYVNVGFTSITMVCKKCDKEQ